MKRFMMIAVVLGGLMVATASNAKADHRSGGGGKSRFAISVSHSSGFNNSGSSFGRRYHAQSSNFPVNGGGYYNGGGFYGGGYRTNGVYGGGYYGGGYGTYGFYGGGIYGGGYGTGIYYPIFAVPIYVGGFNGHNIGHHGGFDAHRHCP